MIHKDITVTDLGSDNWSRLMRLPAELVADGDGIAGRAPRALLVIYRGLKVLKAIDVAERKAVEIEWQGTSRLELLARRTGYPVVIALEETALARVFEHAQRQLDHTDDMVKQWSGFLKGIAAEWRRTIFTYPAGPSRIPVLPPSVLQCAMSSLIPDNSLIVLAVTDRGTAWASVVLGWRDGDFWLVSSLDAVGMEEADLSGEAAARAVHMLEARFGGKAAAIIVERCELAKIVSSRFPLGDMLFALNSGDLRRLEVPLRWRALLLSGAVVSSLRRTLCGSSR